MARKIGVRVEGGKELARKLTKLGPRIAAKAIKKGIRNGAKPILKTAKSIVTRETSTLRRSLGIKVKVYRRTGAVQVTIGPKKSVTGVGPDGRERKPFKYAHLVEFGNDQLPARPFMRPAWEQHKEGLAKSIPDEILAAVEREAVKK